MPDKPISGLSAAGSLLFTDEFAVNETGTTKKVTAAQLALGLGAYNVLAYGAVGDGTTNDATAINAAIAAANTAGGGVVWFPYPPAGTHTYAISAGLVPKSNVTLLSAPNTIIKWTGATSSFMMSASPASGSQLLGFGVNGLTFDAGNTASVTPILLNSWQFGALRNVTLQHVSGAGIAALRMETATGTTAVNNTCGNEIQNLHLIDVPVGIQLSGNGGGTFVTNNRFFGIYAADASGNGAISGTGIRFVQWCDSNQFYYTELLLSANNAIGVIFNDSATPGTDVGVYNDNFYHVDVSGFGLTGLTGLLFNAAKQIFITDLYHSPQVFTGTLVSDNLGRAISYYIMLGQDNTTNNSMELLGKGLNLDTTGALPLSITNSVQFAGVATANDPYLQPGGLNSDTNINLQIKGKGTGGVYLATQRTNFGFFGGANTGAAPALQAIGNDTNVDLQLLGQGTGNIGVGAAGARLKVDSFGHLISDSTGTPTTGTLGTNVTSVTFTGNDVRGKIVIVMSGALAANTRIATCTWAHSFSPVTTIPLLSSETSGAGLAIVNFYSGAESATAFDLFCEQALATGTYTLRYIAIG